MNRGMKLLALLGAGAAGAALAIPNCMKARVAGNEASAIGALKTIATSEATFREGDKEQDGKLDYGTLLALDTNTCSLPNNGVIPTGKDGGPAAAPPENAFKLARGDDATSTFAVDVDTASYSLVKRYLEHQTLPPPELVRVEELVNRFDVRDPAPPTDGKPFAAKVEVASCPWKPAHRLVRVALRGKEIAPAKRPPTNLVFLVDVSGSMQVPERLPLAKQALRLLVEQLGEKDRVALVVYAGAAGLVLPPTPGTARGKILEAIDRLEAGGSTNGSAGIELAYRTAIEGFIAGGMNRVVLCTDGDFNVGLSSADSLEKFIEAKKKSGVFLSALGFGVDREGDRVMERLADRGDGHYAAITDEKEARRVLVKELQGTLFTIAKDVKVQVAFDATRVKSWRLVGYENRVMPNADFKDDAKDGGEIGAGHRVTALYEVEPQPAASPTLADGALLTLRLRWKAPDGQTSTGFEVAAADATTPFVSASADFRFAASVAAGAMLLHHSPHVGDATFAKALDWALAAIGPDATDDRREWLELLSRANELSRAPG